MSNPFKEWNLDDIRRHNERVQNSALKKWTKPEPANENNSETQSTESQRPVCHEPLGQGKGEAGDSGRVHIRIVSRRKRLIDPDNLTPKYFIDCLRYAGLIKDDTADKITLEVSQEKVSKGEEETLIEILATKEGV